MSLGDNMEKFSWQQIFAITVAAICIVILYACIFTLPVWWLWNSLIPEITQGRFTELTFLQALKLNLLFGFCFRIWSPYNKK